MNEDQKDEIMVIARAIRRFTESPENQKGMSGVLDLMRARGWADRLEHLVTGGRSMGDIRGNPEE